MIDDEIKLKKCPNRECKKSNPKIIETDMNGYFTVKCMTCGVIPSYNYSGGKVSAANTWNNLKRS